MREDPRDRPAELLLLAKTAEERAGTATDEDMRRAWRGIAEEWRALAEQARRISKL